MKKSRVCAFFCTCGILVAIIIGENQTVFACRITNFAWGEQDDIWVIQKDGTCRKKDLVEEAEAFGKMNQKRYEPEELGKEV